MYLCYFIFFALIVGTISLNYKDIKAGKPGDFGDITFYNDGFALSNLPTAKYPKIDVYYHMYLECTLLEQFVSVKLPLRQYTDIGLPPFRVCDVGIYLSRTIGASFTVSIIYAYRNERGKEVGICIPYHITTMNEESITTLKRPCQQIFEVFKAPEPVTSTISKAHVGQ